MLDEVGRLIKRFLIFVIGITVVLAGGAMLILPGPAFIVIPVGLLILATEFAWARHLLRRVKELLKTRQGGVTGMPEGKAGKEKDDPLS